jgi:YfiH family protein
VGLDGPTLARRRRAVLDRPWFWLRQVHGTDVVVAGDPSSGPAPGARADAVVTTSDAWALAVHTADCAPLVLLGDGGVIGAVHAGWRGLAAGVVERTVAVMRDLGADTVTGRLGPCIHAECYEFGPDDLEGLVDRFGVEVAGRTREGTPALDLPAGVQRAARDAGVEEVEVDPACTACDARYFSHRARVESGRQATLVWLDNG